jgi:hypothetical protein
VTPLCNDRDTIVTHTHTHLHTHTHTHTYTHTQVPPKVFRNIKDFVAKKVINRCVLSDVYCLLSSVCCLLSKILSRKR